jgi:predicted HTH domain antitoxin
MIKSEEFVKIWQTAGSLGEAAKRAGMTPYRASARASYLRKRGVALRYHRRRQAKLDINHLNELAKRSAKTGK